MEASEGKKANLPEDVRHFFLRQDGVDRQKPGFAEDKKPYKTYGPFKNVGGGDVPKGDKTYIDLYQNVPCSYCSK